MDLVKNYWIILKSIVFIQDKMMLECDTYLISYYEKQNWKVNTSLTSASGKSVLEKLFI
jgi:hypothetical protein